MRGFRVLLSACGALAACFLSAGCQSPWVQATVTNDQNTPVRLVEVDYPGGSFGVQSIAAHAAFHYRFHILEDDQVSLAYTDASGHNRTVKGPPMHQGEQGTLGIAIEPDGRVQWTPVLRARK